jgi:hypothetical protein
MEVRRRSFVAVKEESLWDEKVFEFLTVKHVVYLLIAAVIVYLSSSNVYSFVLGLFVAFFVLACALYPTRSLKFEAILLGFAYYTLYKKKVSVRKRVKVEPVLTSSHREIAKIDVGKITEEDVKHILREQLKS